MHLIRQPQKAHELVTSWQGSRQSVGFVPTMGCLHEGHLSLVKAARERCDRVVVSIFVNPLQFGKNEDLGSYPRPFARDVEMCKGLGVDMIFHPDPTEFYARTFRTRIDSGPIGKLYCGKSRPGFFDGVLTVVNILFNIIKANQAYFGEKDFQQLHLIKQLVRDFRIPVEVVGMPIVREASGLARSSRNEYLKGDQRQAALCLSRALKLAREAFLDGDRSGLSLMRKAEELLRTEPSFSFDYAQIVDEATLDLITGEISRPARLLLAGYMGNAPRIRLIDNCRVNG